MDGKDPWTGREGNVARLAGKGTLTLASFALGGASSASIKAIGSQFALNTTLEVAQTQLAPGHKSELTLLKCGYSVVAAPSLPGAEIGLGSLILSAYDAIDAEKAEAQKSTETSPKP